MSKNKNKHEISDHAAVREIERIYNIDIKGNMAKELFTKENRAKMRFAKGTGSIKTKKRQFFFVNYTVTTIMPPNSPTNMMQPGEKRETSHNK